ncbi:kinase-like domain-containing protein [Pelagophyceae sp. CCMP2097]|nr:kinase-like domain-containing protein [Pelagophyceae sp. CCMP2097]
MGAGASASPRAAAAAVADNRAADAKIPRPAAGGKYKAGAQKALSHPSTAAKHPTAIKLRYTDSAASIVALAQSFRLNLPEIPRPAPAHESTRSGVGGQSLLATGAFATTFDSDSFLAAAGARPPKLCLGASTLAGSALARPPQQAGGQRRGASLRLGPGEYEDEADWIQVDDSEDVLEESLKTPRASLAGRGARARPAVPGLALFTAADESYCFTRSGAIKFNDISGAMIRDTGVANTRSLDDHPDGAALMIPGDENDTAGGRDSGRAGAPKRRAAPPKCGAIPMSDRIVWLEKLGQGAAGRVHKAFDLQQLKFVAMKSVPIVERAKRRQMVHELHALYRSLNGASGAPGRANVVTFFDAFSYLPNASVSLMVEYMDGGSLQAIVDDGGLRDERVLASLAKQAARGLAYLHAKRLLHRDLKPANMLINHRGELKISDFGIVRKLEVESPDRASGADADGQARSPQTRSPRRRRDYDAADAGETLPRVSPHSAAAPERDAALPADIPRMRSAGDVQISDPMNSVEPAAAAGAAKPELELASLRSFCGTVTYMSPERINGERYSIPADVWSLGLTFVAVALGRLPLNESGGYWSLLESIRDAPPPQLPEDEPWSADFRAFLAKCLAKDPARRSTAAGLAAHAFVRDAADDDRGVPRTPAAAQQLLRRAHDELDTMLVACAAHLEGLAKNGARVPGVAPGCRSAAQAARELLVGNQGASKLAALADQLDLPLDAVEARVRAYVSHAAGTPALGRDDSLETINSPRTTDEPQASGDEPDAPHRGPSADRQPEEDCR